MSEQPWSNEQAKAYKEFADRCEKVVEAVASGQPDEEILNTFAHNDQERKLIEEIIERAKQTPK